MGEAAKLTGQISQEVAVMEQIHVRMVTAVPECFHLMQHVDQGWADEPSGVGIYPQPKPFQRALGQSWRRPEFFKVAKPDRARTRCHKRVAVKVRPVMLERKRHIARVACHADKGHALGKRYSIQRGVRLYEAAVLLGPQ